MSTEQHSQNTDVIADHLDTLKQIEIEGYELGVKKARNALFWAGGLILLWELLACFRATGTIDSYTLTFALIIAGIFVGLALWTRKKPYTAVISGIIAFILYKLLVVYANSENGVSVFAALFSGIFVTVLVFVALFRALPDAKKLQQAKEER